jgi:methylated-DNA-[protein]-cysteine S-methyltransferase
VNTIYYHSPAGWLRISENGEAVTAVLWVKAPQEPVETGEEATSLLRETVRQLSEYFAGKRRIFEIPLAPQGTAFQLRTWQALREIPYGETRSYKQIAEAVGCPKGARAIGLANNRNPVSILTPCHRVIGANGQLTGYAGGLEAKAQLLAIEKSAL